MIQDSRSVDVGSELDYGAWGNYSKLVLGLSALAICVDGMANQVLALAIPGMMKEWGASRGAFAPATALGLIGISIGTPLAGILGDRFGRRFGLIVSVLLFGLTTFSMAFIDGMLSLTILRVIAGLGLGGAIPNAASLIAEFTPIRSRSRAVTVGTACIPIGGMFSALISAAVLDSEGWRALFSITGVLCLILTLVFLFLLPESPRYLLRQPRSRNRLIRTLARMGYAFNVETQLVDNSEAKAGSSASALFGNEMRADTFILWAAFFFALLALYSIFNWAPAMLAGLHFSSQVIGVAMTTFGLTGMAGGFCTTWLIERIGSRKTILSVCLIGILGAAYIARVPIDQERGGSYAIAALSIEGIFLGGLQMSLIVLATYIYPAFARATGVGSALGVGRFGAVSSSFTGTLALGLGGVPGFFWSIAAAMSLTIAALFMIRRHIPPLSR